MLHDLQVHNRGDYKHLYQFTIHLATAIRPHVVPEQIDKFWLVSGKKEKLQLFVMKKASNQVDDLIK